MANLSKKNKYRIIFYSSLAILIALGLYNIDTLSSLYNKTASRYTVKERLAQLQSKIDSQLLPAFTSAQISYPPNYVTLFFVKDEKILHLYAGNTPNELKLIKSYEVKAASGKPGPKLKEGDRQVPEGIYNVESLNPNSLFHLSLRVNYPNKDDLYYAKIDLRDKLGSDIMIHGSNASVGCVAIGDEAIEEIFILAARSDYSKWKLVFSPTDFRKNKELGKSNIKWLPELYAKIRKEVVILQ